MLVEMRELSWDAGGSNLVSDDGNLVGYPCRLSVDELVINEAAAVTLALAERGTGHIFFASNVPYS